MHQENVPAYTSTGMATQLAAILAVFAVVQSSPSFAQGCIASRGTGMCRSSDGVHFGDEDAHSAAGFGVSVGYRWLHSDRMFVHDQESPGSDKEINDSHFIDLGLTYTFNSRFSATLTLPYSVHDRSQIVRTKTAQRTELGRFHTQSDGLGDVRLAGNMWLLNPAERRKGNVFLGLGVSAPSGDRDAQDVFSETTLASPRRIVTNPHAVDPSIQLGNGGWGIIVDLYAYREIVPRLNAFLSGSYTLTPEEKYTPTAIRDVYGSDGYSIADSYLCRGGLEFLLWPKYGISLSLAGRVEGVPVDDLTGGSDGFRRPGYAVSIEPGLGIMVKSWSFALNTPVAVYRNREQSNPEQAAGVQPAAAGFADFVVTCSLAKKF